MSELEALQREIDDHRKLLLEKARSGGLLAFTQLTKPDYSVNWHHRVICSFLNRFIRGETTRLIIQIGPRMGKSELVSRRLPALIHGLNPNAEIMMATYNSALASDMAIDIQRIIDRPDYKEIFPNTQITPEGKMSKYARNALEYEIIPYELNGELQFPQGSFRAQGIGGSFTGRGSNYIIIDDPVKNREDADSKNFRDTLYKFYTSTLYSRLEKNGQVLICQTRWHKDDLVGRLLDLAKADPQSDQWTVVSLPALKDSNEATYDPRELDEPLWPDKYSKEKMLTMRATIGTRDWSALYQQQPTAEEGNIFKAPWFKEYKVLPERFDQVIQSWDFAVKDKNSSDYTVGLVLGRIGTYKYLIHMERGRWPFPVACQKLLEVSRRFPLSHKKALEMKANGPAVKQTLDKQVPGIVEIEPRGDKIARANAVSPDFEAGNVYLPSAQLAPWVHEVITEMCDFPNAAHDDIVDAFTQGIDLLRNSYTGFLPISGHGSGIIF